MDEIFMVSEQNLNVMTLDILKVRKEMTGVKRRRRAEEQGSSVRMCHPYSPTEPPSPPEGPHTWGNILCHHRDIHNTLNKGLFNLSWG